GIGTGPGHGRLLAWNPDTGQKRNVTVWPEVLSATVAGVGARDMKYRFQWTFPVEMSPHDPDVLYICSNFIHRSTDNGTSWETISPDLTRNDPEKLGPSGGPITADNSGAEIYCTIFAFRESPHENGVFWAGSDDGLVHISRDGGKTWNNVTPKGLPEWSLISIIEPSPHDPATAYVAATNYKNDDTAPYLFKTNDYGATWTAITSGIGERDFTRVIREDPNRRGLLYAGTETGVYISLDDGAHWQPFQSNLPVTPIHDLVVKGTDLIAATHGRAFWVLDDLSPLYQIEASSAEAPVTLFKPRDTMRFHYEYDAWEPEEVPTGYVGYQMVGPVTVAVRQRQTPSGTNTFDYLDAGKNPPSGVIVHFAFATKPEDEVKLAILDAQGNTIRTYSSKGDDLPRVPAEAGANRFVWNLRYPRPTALEDPDKKDEKKSASALMADKALAPRALSGDYQVRITVGETTVTQPFTVLPDPRLPVTAEDLKAQFDLKSGIRDQLDQVHKTINQLRRLRKQVESWEERAKANEQDETYKQLKDAASALKDQLKAAESTFINVDAEKPLEGGAAKLKEKLATLGSMIEESDDAPTKGSFEVFAMLSEQVQAQQAMVQHLIAEDVKAFNDRVRASEVPAVGA
ncbi:MAG: glycosyl hydrolase, partial [Ktedonobacterales bacterium]